MTKIRSDSIIKILRTQPRIGAAALRSELGDISRATLSRAIKQLGNSVVSGGGSRRIRYALSRTLRGNAHPSLFTASIRMVMAMKSVNLRSHILKAVISRQLHFFVGRWIKT